MPITEDDVTAVIQSVPDMDRRLALQLLSHNLTDLERAILNPVDILQYLDRRVPYIMTKISWARQSKSLDKVQGSDKQSDFFQASTATTTESALAFPAQILTLAWSAGLESWKGLTSASEPKPKDE